MILNRQSTHPFSIARSNHNKKMQCRRCLRKIQNESMQKNRSIDAKGGRIRSVGRPLYRNGGSEHRTQKSMELLRRMPIHGNGVKGFLDDMFERTVERWTQSSSYMDSIIPRALNSPCFVRTVAKFISKNWKNQAESIDKKRNWPTSLW